jgi:hypothetical protein
LPFLKTVKHFRQVVALFALALFAANAHGQSSARDRRLIAYAKKLPASKLDSQLPHQPFVSWFRSVVGASAKIDWEINDCGEQTGNPNDPNSINPPLCAQSHAHLSDGRNVYVLIHVGSHRAGIKGRRMSGRFLLMIAALEGCANLRRCFGSEPFAGGNPTNRWTRADSAGLSSTTYP